MPISPPLKLHGSPLLNFCIITIYSPFYKKSLIQFRISPCQTAPFKDFAPLKMCQRLLQNYFLGSLQDGKISSLLLCIRNKQYDVINLRQIAKYNSIELNKLINTCIVNNATVMYVGYCCSYISVALKKHSLQRTSQCNSVVCKVTTVLG